MTAGDRGSSTSGAKRDREEGSIAVELVILTPLLLVLLMFVVGLGRIAHASAEVEGAAADAARSASLLRTPAAARDAGENAAREYLDGGSCRSLDVDIDTTRLLPGGAVTARLRCTASLARLGLAGFPGTGRSPRPSASPSTPTGGKLADDFVRLPTASRTRGSRRRPSR